MKKAFFLFAVAASLMACNSNDSNSSDGDGTGTGPGSTDEDTTSTSVQTVPNVNGNIPDTTNSINISTEKGNMGDTTKH